MADPVHPYKSLQSKGIAVGWSNIKNDSLVFEFRGERFEFPAMELLPNIAKYNGYFYVAKVKALRKLALAKGLKDERRLPER